VFWVISVYFNIRNTLPKSGTFLLGHPVYTMSIPEHLQIFIEVALLEQSSAEADNYLVRPIVVCTRVLGLTLLRYISVSQTFLLADPLWLQKITTDLHMLAHVNRASG